MIGFNGGLVGKNRSAANATSVPGVWNLSEQAINASVGKWPLSVTGSPSFITASIGNISTISNSGTTTLSLTNLISLLNTSTFQNRLLTTNSSFTLPAVAGSSWSFSWINADTAIFSKMYLRVQRLAAGDCSWQIQGSGIQSYSALSPGGSVEHIIDMLAPSGNATISILNSFGLAIQDIAFGGGTQGNVQVLWSQP